MDSSIWPLTLGAAGALLAIYMKEAVQAAVQRRVIAWQLFAYLIWWKSQIVKHGPAVRVYQEVEKRDKALIASLSNGTESFRKQHEQHAKERSDVRETIRAAVLEAIEKRPALEAGGPLQDVVMKEFAAFVTMQRGLLADSKSFISDRDAALLGKSFALYVVQFRVALLYVMAAFEGIAKTVLIEDKQTATTVATLVDQLLVAGEELLVAMIRLERNVDSLTKKSLIGLTADVLRGR